MVDSERVASVVQDLEAIGVGLSIDDDGIGHSTLSYLRTMPVHELKLDRNFVTGIAASPKDQAIVEAVVSLARSLGLCLVAEGIETSSDWDHLCGLGVDIAQGYLISRPQPPRALAAWLAEWPALAERDSLGGIADLADWLGYPGASVN
jgi:EAL domain-containing protein (putative c-di-GMP-specific phosphodiesterase class I)